MYRPSDKLIFEFVASCFKIKIMEQQSQINFLLPVLEEGIHN